MVPIVGKGTIKSWSEGQNKGPLMVIRIQSVLGFCTPPRYVSQKSLTVKKKHWIPLIAFQGGSQELSIG